MRILALSDAASRELSASVLESTRSLLRARGVEIDDTCDPQAARDVATFDVLWLIGADAADHADVARAATAAGRGVVWSPGAPTTASVPPTGVDAWHELPQVSAVDQRRQRELAATCDAVFVDGREAAAAWAENGLSERPHAIVELPPAGATVAPETPTSAGPTPPVVLVLAPDDAAAHAPVATIRAALDGIGLAVEIAGAHAIDRACSAAITLVVSTPGARSLLLAAAAAAAHLVVVGDDLDDVVGDLAPRVALDATPERVRAVVERALAGTTDHAERTATRRLRARSRDGSLRRVELTIDALQAAAERGRRRRRGTDSPTGTRVGVHFHGVVLGTSGYAAEGREWLAALETAGFAPSLTGASLESGRAPACAATEPDRPRRQRERLARCAARPPAADRVVFHHVPIPAFEPDPSAVANVALALFETTSLPPGWGARLARADAVVVRSAWAVECFVRGGVAREKLVVVPPPFDAASYPATSEPNETRPGGRPFRWLTALDWTRRKGWDVVLETFGATFAAGEAELVVKTTPQSFDVAARCRDVVQRAAGPDRQPPTVHVVADLLDDDAHRALFTTADGFVLASRGEGWGRTVHEAMLLGVPVVVTGASALTALVPDGSVGYPVRAREVDVDEAAIAEASCFRGQRWWEPDRTHLATQLRAVMADPNGAARRARRAREHVLTLCDGDAIATRLGALVERVTAAGPRRRAAQPASAAASHDPARPPATPRRAP